MHERDRHTDTGRQTPHDDIGRACIASRGKNNELFFVSSNVYNCQITAINFVFCISVTSRLNLCIWATNQSKGLDTCYNCHLHESDSWPAALHNLESSSWLACKVMGHFPTLLFFLWFLQFAHRSSDLDQWGLASFRARMCLFFWGGGSEQCSLDFRVKPEKAKIFAEWIGLSRLKNKKIQILITLKLLSRTQNSLNPIHTTNTPSCVVPWLPNKSKIPDGGHLEFGKMLKSPQRTKIPAPNLAGRCIAVNVREIDVLWSNGFRHVFNCCWQENVKPLQFYCHTLPLSYQLHERQLVFYRRLLLSDNIVLRTVADLPRVRCEMLDIAGKYDVDDLHYST